MIRSSVRRPRASDLPDIEKVAANYTMPLATEFESAGVVERDDKVISFGVTRIILESILYTSGSDRDKVESLKALLELAESDARKMKFDDMYVFAQDEDFANILCKHFGFRRAQGIPLIKDFEVLGE